MNTVPVQVHSCKVVHMGFQNMKQLNLSLLGYTYQLMKFLKEFFNIYLDIRSINRQRE
jgi:hypothetical protein